MTDLHYHVIDLFPREAQGVERRRRRRRRRRGMGGWGGGGGWRVMAFPVATTGINPRCTRRGFIGDRAGQRIVG
jgi:hypothetical protein